MTSSSKCVYIYLRNPVYMCLAHSWHLNYLIHVQYKSLTIQGRTRTSFFPDSQVLTDCFHGRCACIHACVVEVGWRVKLYSSSLDPKQELGEEKGHGKDLVRGGTRSSFPSPKEDSDQLDPWNPETILLLGGAFSYRTNSSASADSVSRADL